jgi:hypothetical protein
MKNFPPVSKRERNRFLCFIRSSLDELDSIDISLLSTLVVLMSFHYEPVRQLLWKFYCDAGLTNPGKS